jgi:hypothetical protein
MELCWEVLQFYLQYGNMAILSLSREMVGILMNWDQFMAAWPSILWCVKENQQPT